MISDLAAINASVQQFQPAKTFDLVFTCGLLIHISPEDLESAYANIARAAGRYVLFIEYFNPTPVDIHYRGHSGKLFKRDFAGEFLDAQSHFDVVQYGFLWKRIEPAWDNAPWTLLQRQKG